VASRLDALLESTAELVLSSDTIKSKLIANHEGERLEEQQIVM